jgi:hypothetical protein
VFGSDDFALAPLDGSGLDDSFLNGFNEGSGLDGLDTSGSGSRPRSRPRTTTPPASTSTPTTQPTSPPTTQPTSPPATQPTTSPTTSPEPPPNPPLLGFNASVWMPLGVGQGNLSVTIGEAGVPAGLTATAFSAPAGLTGAAAPVRPTAAADDPAPLRLELSLSAGAKADPQGTLDDRCGPPQPVPGPVGGQLITCTLDQPPTGGTDTFTFALVVDEPDQTAKLRLFRGDAQEAEFPTISLDRLEDDVALTTPAWTPYPGRGSVQLPLGELSVGATSTGKRPITGAAIRITLAGHAGFVPPELFSDQLPPEGLLDSPPLGNLLPTELHDVLLDRVLDPLPAGCAVEGWTPPTGETSWSQVLQGGLPDTMVCQAGALTPATPASFPTLLAATNPLYNGPGGTTAGAHATVQLELSGVPAGTPATVDMQPRGGEPG